MLADDRADTRRPLAAACVSRSSCSSALAGYGALRLSRTPTAFVDNVRLRIMQPNLQQDDKFNYAAKQQGDEPLSRAVGPRDRAADRPACAT